MAHSRNILGAVPGHAMNPPPPPPAVMGPVPMGVLGPQPSLGPPGPPVSMPTPLGPQGPPIPPHTVVPPIIPGAGPIPPQPTPPGAQGPPQSSLVNPATNDAPLEFNLNKNKPPMPVAVKLDAEDKRTARDDDMGRDRRDRDRDSRDRDRRDRKEERSKSQSLSPNSNGPTLPPQSSSAPAVPPAGAIGSTTAATTNMWGGMMGMGYTMMGMLPGTVMGDPSLMGMGQFGMMGSMVADGAMVPTGSLVKEIIHCKSCTLFPPNPNAPPPTTRERPPGCRTVFVGGLPENITEEIIREVFERCGEITTIRMSKKNFCHIRFELESFVDTAIYLSGYRIRLGSHTDAPNTGRLHVDYAQARDDLYEWECRQRQLQREQRHRERLEQERLRPPSPPPVVHYTDHEAQAIAEKIKGDDSFIKAVQVVITWLERGDCSKRNANQFYSMIQSTNSHVRRLMNEKGQYEEELQRAKDLMKQRMQGILMQFGQIERVFMAASHQKVWDHFTKAQRKNIDMWKKQAAEIKNMQLEEALNERADEEMEVSDSEEEMNIPRKKPRMEDDKGIGALKEENDSLRCQLEAYKNEVDLIRSDLGAEVDHKDKQLKLLQQTLQGMQQQLLEAKRRQAEDERNTRELEARLRAAGTVESSDKSGGQNDDDDNRIDTTDSSPHGTRITEKEARLIGLISTFLHVHPFGAGVDYIWSYLQKVEPTLRPSDVEGLMSKFPAVFRQELSGIGANMERKWLFAGFQNSSS